jgi:hypothetical protein
MTGKKDLKKIVFRGDTSDTVPSRLFIRSIVAYRYRYRIASFDQVFVLNFWQLLIKFLFVLDRFRPDKLFDNFWQSFCLDLASVLTKFLLRLFISFWTCCFSRIVSISDLRSCSTKSITEKQNKEVKWRRCTVDIASASGTEDPGSNPAGYKVHRETMTILLSLINLMSLVYVLPWRRGAVDIASASGTEDMGSNPGWEGNHDNAFVSNWLTKHCLCVYWSIGHKKKQQMK